jgi:hypothetical protein
MRIASRLLGLAASSLALLGFLGCQEDNERGVMNESVGKSGVDPNARTGYDQLKLKPAGAAPSSGATPEKSKTPASDTSK